MQNHTMPASDHLRRLVLAHEWQFSKLPEFFFNRLLNHIHVHMTALHRNESLFRVLGVGALL